MITSAVFFFLLVFIYLFIFVFPPNLVSRILLFYLLQSPLFSVFMISLQESYKLSLWPCNISLILYSLLLSSLSLSSPSPPISSSVAANSTWNKTLTRSFCRIIFSPPTFWTFMPTLYLHGRSSSSPICTSLHISRSSCTCHLLLSGFFLPLPPDACGLYAFQTKTWLHIRVAF